MNSTKNTLVKSSIPGQSQNDDFQTDIATCTHGFDVLSIVGIRKDFVSAFEIAFNNAADDDGAAGGIWSSIVEAKNATSEDYAEVWKDVSMMKWVISYMLYHGTRCVLDDNVDFARDLAAVTRYFEQCIAVELNKTKAIIDWTAIDELYEADEHTLVKFFRKGIRCSCLDEKYKEVKCIPKMGRCYNVECTLPDGRVERSKMMCCSRCRQMTYCSRECQQASWANHKKFCNNYLAIKAEFDAKKAQKKKIDAKQQQKEKQQQHTKEKNKNNCSSDLDHVKKFVDFSRLDLGKDHSTSHVRQCNSLTCDNCQEIGGGVVFVKSKTMLSTSS